MITKNTEISINNQGKINQISNNFQQTTNDNQEPELKNKCPQKNN